MDEPMPVGCSPWRSRGVRKEQQKETTRAAPRHAEGSVTWGKHGELTSGREEGEVLD